MPGNSALRFGVVVAALQFAGSIKALPWAQALPVDPTVVLLGLAIVLGAGRVLALGLPVAPGPGLFLAALGGLGAWFTLSAAWSPGPLVAQAKLAELVLLGPLAAGLGILVGREEAAILGFGRAVSALACAIAVLLVVWPPWASSLPGLSGLRTGYQHANHVFAVGAGALAARVAVSGGTGRWVAVLATALLALAALGTGGRAGFAALGLAATLAPALVMLRRGLPGRAVLAALVPVAVLGLGLALLLADPAAARAWRTLSRFLEGDLGESSARLPLWRAAFDLAGRSLPEGLGVGGFPAAAGFGELRRMWPHNHLIEALTEGGLPGLVLFLAAWGAAIGTGLAQAKRTAPEPAAIALVQGAVQLLLISVSTDLGNRQAWLSAGILAGLGAARSPVPLREARAVPS